jgi:hypothetical protein
MWMKKNGWLLITGPHNNGRFTAQKYTMFSLRSQKLHWTHRTCQKKIVAPCYKIWLTMTHHSVISMQSVMTENGHHTKYRHISKTHTHTHTRARARARTHTQTVGTFQHVQLIHDYLTIYQLWLHKFQFIFTFFGFSLPEAFHCFLCTPSSGTSTCLHFHGYSDPLHRKHRNASGKENPKKGEYKLELVQS